MEREPPRRSVEDIAREVREENPDPITRRESFELELMEEDRTDEGADVEVNTDDDTDDDADDV
jgi:hypothetical protein